MWRAQDEQQDRAVAVKLLHRELLPDERSRARFAAEARMVANLTHPGILTVYDIVVDDHQAAIVLELVDGEPLSDVLAKRGRLPEAAAASITAQVAHALQAAHDRGLVHRDVKPANVLVSPDGRVRVVDFGIARALDERESTRAQPGTIMGTRRYLAPEQLADGAADRATDVFGLGSLLYEMLVARPPFPAATPAAMMAQQRQGAPQILSVSPELAGLARTALQLDPERRPRSAGRMAAFLERWLENRDVASADLPAVTAAALSGDPLPHPEPVVRWRPEVTPAPIVEITLDTVSGSAPASSRPARRRARIAAGKAETVRPVSADPVALVAPGSIWTPVEGTARVALPAVAPADDEYRAPDQLSGGSPRMKIGSAAATAVRMSTSTPLAIGRRRVPLVSAVGLAGLLLAGLLLAGALTALQAGSTRQAPSATPVASAESTPEPSPAATPAPTASPSPAIVAPTLPTPGDQTRRRSE